MLLHPYQLPPEVPSFLPSRQNKVVTQREYRKKEHECFKTLQGIIKHLTGQEPKTRHEILEKAISMLLAAAANRKWSEAQWQISTLSEAPSPTLQLAEDTVDYSLQSPDYPPDWYSHVESDALASDLLLDRPFMSGSANSILVTHHAGRGGNWFT